MKRYAAHYMWSENSGFQKQQVVEMKGEEVYRIFPLSEEIESVEWFPGVIVLTTKKGLTLEEVKQVLRKPEEANSTHPLYAYLMYPFNFILMQPADETRHRQLR